MGNIFQRGCHSRGGGRGTVDEGELPVANSDREIEQIDGNAFRKLEMMFCGVA